MEDKIKDVSNDKGLTDKHNGELILNETGTSIEVGHLEDQELNSEQQQIESLPQKPEGEDVEKGIVQPRFNITDEA